MYNSGRKSLSDFVFVTVPADGLICRHKPCAHPNNDTSIEFEILPKFAMLWYEIYSTDHNEILHTSRQLHSRDVYKISVWSVEHILN